MSFIHKNKVVLLKLINRYGFGFSLFPQLVHVDHQNIGIRIIEQIIFVEKSGGYVGQFQLIKVLQRHVFIGGKHNDIVDFQVAVLAFCPIEIMQKLQDVDVHQQGFTRAGGTHICQFVQGFFRKCRDPDQA